MKTLILLLNVFLAFNLCHSQTEIDDKHFQSIESYYGAIENHGLTSEALRDLESDLVWERLPYIDSIHDPYNITLEEILQNDWVRVEVTNLKFKYTIDNKIIVTGIFSGRQPSECNNVSSTFEHIWIKKDDAAQQITKISKN